MAPPSNVPSRQSIALGPAQQSLPVKKSKETPPLQSPPSEEVEEILQEQLKVINHNYMAC